MVRMNEALARISGDPVGEQIGRTIAERLPELWPQLEPLYRRVVETLEPVINVETSADLPGDPGNVQTWLTSLYPVRPEGEEVIGIGIVVVDITERKAMEVRLKELTERDPLTGIHNRRRFLFELERAVASDARYGHGGAVLMLDIDNFKLTNDSYGRATGDHILISVAEVLSARLRKTDFAARIGGDGFALLLAEVTSEQALKVALDLRSRLNERPTGPPVQVSIGIVMLGEDEDLTIDDLLAAADNAMYQSKEAGGDQATVYRGPVGEVLSRVRDLQEALEEKRFVLHSQPIVELKSGRVAFRELLIRMRSRAGEIIPTADFLGLAQEFSLMGQIDHWVVGEALRLARQEPVTINLSARSVGDLGILAAVRKAIALGLDPRALMFEITETAVMADFDRAVAFANSLKDLGCELALDDFGTGFGTFTYLKRLPARYLKIDMEFVRDIKDDPTDAEIVGSIVRIALTLGKETIAEGVENASGLEMLRDLGVDYVQGWHLGRPEPTPEDESKPMIASD
jgi:diguanylate cyclase (GGDEF)-like protein